MNPPHSNEQNKSVLFRSDTVVTVKQVKVMLQMSADITNSLNSKKRDKLEERLVILSSESNMNQITEASIMILLYILKYKVNDAYRGRWLLS